MTPKLYPSPQSKQQHIDFRCFRSVFFFFRISGPSSGVRHASVTAPRGLIGQRQPPHPPLRTSPLCPDIRQTPPGGVQRGPPGFMKAWRGAVLGSPTICARRFQAGEQLRLQRAEQGSVQLGSPRRVCPPAEEGGRI